MFIYDTVVLTLVLREEILSGLHIRRATHIVIVLCKMQYLWRTYNNNMRI